MTQLGQPEQDTPRYAPPVMPRVPWSLKLAGWSWVVAGIVLVLVPLAATLMARSQYLSLRRNGFFIADLAERLDPGDYVQLEPYLAEFERLEAMVLSAPGWLVGILIVTYALVALVTLAGYLLIGISTARGVDWTRWTGSVLTIVSSIIVFQIWQFFAVIAWLPISALATNHIGLAVIALQVTGVVFAFIPPSNAYFKKRREFTRILSASAPHLT